MAVELLITADGQLRLSGPPEARAKWREILEPHRAALLRLPSMVAAFQADQGEDEGEGDDGGREL
jgi:hypothetical protein